jgi:hypothetical protein
MTLTRIALTGEHEALWEPRDVTNGGAPEPPPLAAQVLVRRRTQNPRQPTQAQLPEAAVAQDRLLLTKFSAMDVPSVSSGITIQAHR